MKVALQKLSLLIFLALAFAAVASAQGRTGVVTSTRANLRETPSQTGQVKQEVPVGSEITILDSKGAWYVVRIADAVGWMHGNTFRFASDADVREAKPTIDQAPVYPAGTSSRPARIKADSATSDTDGSQSNSAGGYIRGPRGGCYHYSKSGRKVYVDRSLCN
jgi:uncharacterized protein YgiM (DUF1202 family)